MFGVGNFPEIQSFDPHLSTILKLPKPQAPFPNDLFHMDWGTTRLLGGYLTVLNSYPHCTRS